MPDNSRAQRRALAYLFAVPVIAIVYLGVLATRIWSALRPAVAVALGATVISSVYAEEAYKRAPATPIKAGATLALAFVLIGHGMAPAPVAAAGNPAEAVIAAARDYLGRGYELGAEGPKRFDCSGFIYRAFLDAGELPRVGGMRLRAAGYMRWFIARGQFTRDQDKADRGDLVVWDNGEHIGIYLGEGKAISALIDPWGVSVHSLKGIHMPVDYFLKVDWRNGDGPGDGNGNNGNGNNGNGNNNNNGNNDPGRGPGNGDSTGRGNDSENPGNGNPDPGNTPDNGNNAPDPGDNPGNGDNPGSGADTDGPDDGTGPDDSGTQGPPAPDQPGALPNGPRGGGKQGYTTGTLNIRVSADPSARIVGWLGKNRTVKIVDQGNSPAGYLWFRVETTTGRSGWVFSHWVRQL
jgi:cell wall-associated NlpC family hydrolase